MRKGTAYRDVLAALAGCGTRSRGPASATSSTQSWWSIPAHLASLGSPDTDRWLPIFCRSTTSRPQRRTPARELTMGLVDGRLSRPAAREAFAEGDGRLGQGG